MSKPLMRRKRLPDGSFGKLEKVMPGETDQEKIDRLEKENGALNEAIFELMNEQYRSDMENKEAIFELMNLL